MLYLSIGLIYPKHSVPSRNGTKLKCHKIKSRKIKIIKANSPSMSSCPANSEQNQDQRPVVVPTVRIIKNDRHLIKTPKSCIERKESAKDNKFSTRRKASTVISERKVMFGQSNQFIKSKEDDEEEEQQQHQEEDAETCSDRLSKVPPMKRREHNDSERKRRDHLRNSFVNLKDQIPKLKSSEKRPPRIMILHEATNYVLHLNEKQKYLENTLNAEMEKREKLLKMLSQEIKVGSI